MGLWDSPHINSIKHSEPLVRGVLLTLLERPMGIDYYKGHIRQHKLESIPKTFSTGVMSEMEWSAQNVCNMPPGQKMLLWDFWTSSKPQGGLGRGAGPKACFAPEKQHVLGPACFRTSSGLKLGPERKLGCQLRGSLGDLAVCSLIVSVECASVQAVALLTYQS